MTAAAPFAALEQAVNTTAMAALANAVAQVGGASVPVIFDQQYEAPFAMEADASLCTCTGPAAALGQLERGDEIAVNGVAYRIERAQPDGTGLITLVIYPVSTA